MKINKWNYINWSMFVVLGIFVAEILDLHMHQWQWWILVLIVILIGFTAAVAERNRHETD